MIPLRTSVSVAAATPLVWLLLAANVGFFLLMRTLSPAAYEAFLYEFALVPARYTFPEIAREGGLDPLSPLPLLTSIFLHGSWMHLVVNMWTLWLFGRPIEARMGSVRFGLFYLACGVLASVAHLLFNLTSLVPTVGASGAIAGVLGAYTIEYPRARVVMLVPLGLIPILWSFPAPLYTGLWFFIQLLSGTAALQVPQPGAGIAWWAHVGGFLAGLALFRVIRPASPPPPPTLGAAPPGLRHRRPGRGPWERDDPAAEARERPAAGEAGAPLGDRSPRPREGRSWIPTTRARPTPGPR
ncbi:MAG: rhomboid family intramembrane serine protease [Proteobacteria bacterium]|nr:rhomboid family intramembrane serine protease [Pseudomonadota bacterium]